MKRIKRALISVYDKTGIVEFARTLANLDVEIVSTGGTSRLLEQNGIKVRDRAVGHRVLAALAHRRDDGGRSGHSHHREHGHSQQQASCTHEIRPSVAC